MNKICIFVALVALVIIWFVMFTPAGANGYHSTPTATPSVPPCEAGYDWESPCITCHEPTNEYFYNLPIIMKEVR